MTNPDNIVRYNTRNGGRGSMAGANAWAQYCNRGSINSFGTVRASDPAGLSVTVGPADSGAPIEVVAVCPNGQNVAIELIDSTVLTIAKPLTDPRISAVVAYTNDPAISSEQTNVTGSPDSCGLIVVHGDESATSPMEPSDSQIRSAITADGGTGANAAYVVLGKMKVEAGTAAIADSMIYTPVSSIVPLATAIKKDTDLNTLDYCQPGVYNCTYDLTAQSLTHCPTYTAFRMEVYNMTSSAKNVVQADPWVNLLRKIIDNDGKEWIQTVRSSSNATWSYGAWRDVAPSATEITVSDFITLNPSSIYAIPEGSIYRCGALVTLDIVVTKTSGGGFYYDEIGTIKAPYRPLKDLSTFCSIGDLVTSQGETDYCYLGINGSVFIGASGSSAEKANISLTYPVALA